MFETLLIALVLIIVGTLLLGLLIHIITKAVNISLESELHKESMHHKRRNKTHHESDILSDLTELERETFDRLIGEFDRNMDTDRILNKRRMTY